MSKHISDNPDNFKSAFDLSMATADRVSKGNMKPEVASQVASNTYNAIKALEGDIRARVLTAELMGHAAAAAAKPALTKD